MIEGNSEEAKVPFTSGCFCGLSALENALSLRVAATVLEKLSPRFPGGWLEDREGMPTETCLSFLYVFF